MIEYGKNENLPVENADFTDAETKEQMLSCEEDIIQGLIEAANFKSDERKKIEIVRGGKLFYSFEIQPLSEDEYNAARKKHTKNQKNRRLGIVVSNDVNAVKYRDQLIYNATVPEDRKRLWDNKKVWSALNAKNIDIVSPLDVIEYTLKAGEKDRIIDIIDQISGFDGDTDIEETAKN